MLFMCVQRYLRALNVIYVRTTFFLCAYSDVYVLQCNLNACKSIQLCKMISKSKIFQQMLPDLPGIAVNFKIQFSNCQIRTPTRGILVYILFMNV